MNMVQFVNLSEVYTSSLNWLIPTNVICYSYERPLY